MDYINRPSSIECVMKVRFAALRIGLRAHKSAAGVTVLFLLKMRIGKPTSVENVTKKFSDDTRRRER